MPTLTGKTAIVTGASSGIGRATALLFAREGARVVAVARRLEPLEAVVSAIVSKGGEAVAVDGDVGEETTAQRAVAAALDHFGGLDIGFNNAAALGPGTPLEELTPEAWTHTLRTNLDAAYFAARHQVPAMRARGGGSLIFTGSFVGHTAGIPGMAAYAASKAGLIGLTQVLAAELGPARIRVNTVLPGGTDTPMSITNAPGATAETLAFVEGLHALKRMARPEEIAQAVLYLASDAASFVTGSAMRVDGGASICRV